MNMIKNNGASSLSILIVISVLSLSMLVMGFKVTSSQTKEANNRFIAIYTKNLAESLVQNAINEIHDNSGEGYLNFKNLLSSPDKTQFLTVNSYINYDVSVSMKKIALINKNTTNTDVAEIQDEKLYFEISAHVKHKNQLGESTVIAGLAYDI